MLGGTTRSVLSAALGSGDRKGSQQLLSLLLRTEVAAGTGLPDPVARGVSMVGLEPPDAVFSGLKPSSSILGALGPGGETEALSHQDRCTPCPTVLISRTFRHVSSNSQTTTNPASPERCPPHNPNPCRPPKTSSLCLGGGSCKKKRAPPQLPLWDHLNQSQQCQVSPRCARERLQNLADADICSHSLRVRGAGGLQELLREVFPRQTDLWA